ncbi:MAG TPA: hypothetical protein VFG13_00525 [Blastococcus sp.]|nr:hypothetical protein [Blastococcus sp.]
MDEPTGPRRRALDRLFGAAADPTAPRPERPRTEAPGALLWAAVVVGVQAAAVGVGAVAWLWLTLTSTPDSVARAIAEVVLLALVAVGLGAAARGLARVAGWARGPVIAAQIFFGLSGFVTAFEAQRPLFGLPVLLTVAAVLYLLATPEARLAYLEPDGS